MKSPDSFHRLRVEKIRMACQSARLARQWDEPPGTMWRGSANVSCTVRRVLMLIDKRAVMGRLAATTHSGMAVARITVARNTRT
jgi:hypothetical protein